MGIADLKLGVAVHSGWCNSYFPRLDALKSHADSSRSEWDLDALFALWVKIITPDLFVGA